MPRRWSHTPVIALLLVGLVLLTASLLPHGAVDGAAGGPAASPVEIARVRSSPDTLFGQFNGEVKLDVTVLGVYSNTLATPTRSPTQTPPPPDLGAIDLSLQLSQTGNRLVGFVDLDRTLVFTAESMIMATPVIPTPLPGTPTPGATPLKIGPGVTGTLTGASLHLESDRVSGVIASQPIQRQFRLTGVVTWEADVVTLTGEYRETVWGYVPQPLTLIGRFTLRQGLFTRDAILTTTPTPGATRTMTPTVAATPTATATPTASVTPTPTVITPAATTTPSATTIPSATVSPTVTVSATATRQTGYLLYLPQLLRRH